MFIGYTRVSTFEQNDNLQHDALKAAGCQKIYSDKISGFTDIRPGLASLKGSLRQGDTLVVWRLDRLGRSLKHLIEWVGFLEKEGIGLKSLQESIDTTTASGKMIFHIFGSLSEFERNLIRERTNAGLAAAKARGKLGGRPKKSSDKKRKIIVDLFNKKELPVKELCEMYDISKPTLYKYVREQQV